jgi:cyclic pyranopterin phosphate synthase
MDQGSLVSLARPGRKSPFPIVAKPTAPSANPPASPLVNFRPLTDGQQRSVRYLRVSVTDRCNFRCLYCMPEDGLAFVPRSDVLSFEEITRLVRNFAALGVNRVRLTGGEPLLRLDLPHLVAQLAAIPGVQDLSLSTNGFLLPEHAHALRAAGLTRVNISLDTLDAARFAAITRTGSLARVLGGLHAAKAAGLAPIKLNAVVLRDRNDDELPALVRFAARHGHVLRFIEHMPIGVDGFWSDASFVPIAEMKSRLAEAYDFDDATTPTVGGGPARYLRLTPRDASHAPVDVGFITAVSDHFCDTCNRVRLTATGTLQACLAFPGTLSLRDAMRAGASDDALTTLIADALAGKGEGHGFAAGQYTLQSMSITGG